MEQMVMSGLSDWINESEPAQNMFGLRRKYELRLESYLLIGDPFVCDIRRRGFFERWFTAPWHPFLKTEYSPTAHWVNIDEPYCIVSIQTFLKIEKNISK